MKRNDEHTEITIAVRKLISEKFNYTARISNIWHFLALSFGIKEFEILDMRLLQNGVFESYIIDKYIDWIQGKDIDFTEIYESILKTGNFTESEKILMKSANPEERICGIFLAISDPV